LYLNTDSGKGLRRRVGEGFVITVNSGGQNIFNGFFRAVFFRIFAPQKAFFGEDQAGSNSGAQLLTVLQLIRPGVAMRHLP
jgi:hypothetical protein